MFTVHQSLNIGCQHSCCQDSNVQDQDQDWDLQDQDQDFEFQDQDQDSAVQDQDQDQDFELQWCADMKMMTN